MIIAFAFALLTFTKPAACDLTTSVMRPGPKTSDDIGVGTSIRRFRHAKRFELLQDDHHSGGVPMQIADRCGMGFFLSAWRPVQAVDDEGIIRVRNEFDRWPDSIHITSVVVFGCRK